jgi:predicted amidohydrolase YtcJ
MQPVHCTSDIDLAERYWGSRRERAYPWRRLLESGALLAFGSDAPVESPSTAWGLHAAVTRERRGAGSPFVPEQRIDLDAALTAYTATPARLAGLWPLHGNLSAGAAADLVIWNADLHRLPAAELAHACPITTILAGEVVHGEGSERPSSGFAPRLESVPAAGGRR